MSPSHITPLYYPLNYIFALELDIIVKFYTADYGTKHHGEVDQRTEAYSPRHTVPKQIAKVLRKNGLEADSPGYSSRNSDGVNSWTIGEGPFLALLDYDGEESDTGKWSFCTVKIISPDLKYTYESFFQLDRVLRIINEKFDVGVSPSCGLNVHVGINYPDENERLESKGYPLQTLKNLLQLFSLFWPQLNNIHSPSPMSRKEQQFPNDFFLRGMDPLDAAATIESCDCIFELFKLWENTEHATEAGRWINPLCQISNLLSRAEYNSAEHRTRTVLFRQHEATLDFERVYHWIKLLVRMVRFSHECGPAGLPLSLLLDADQERRTQAGHLDTIAFLKAIGARTCAKFYQGRLYTRESTSNPNGLEEDDLREFWEDIDSSSSASGEEELMPTPSDSSSTTDSDYEEAISDNGGSLTSFRGSPPPMCTPPGSYMNESPPRKDENSMLASQGLSIPSTLVSEWWHIVDKLKPFGDNNDGPGSVTSGSSSSSNQSGDLFQSQFPPDFEEPDEHIISAGEEHSTYDLTHRKVQY